MRNQSAAQSSAVDASNPWLGLASFTEETRAYFFGRDEEIAELARRVQRKLLTVLFGQSGLGKTSILRAGLVPRLRGQGYCPVYVRIDYARGTPEPAEQIKAAIRLAARGSGQWTQEGVASEGESLWEFLHHRDDILRDETGNTVIPLLIFDQFEEIFTLAQGDDSGRARAARFVSELADLVENRPPEALEARLDEDEGAAERFDFARSDYRVLLALREDYLAPLEGLKKEIPSIGQNRLRLAPMTGTQALAAVLQPGKGLVSDEVAAAIVRFVAGGAELSNAEVEPSLLSLICRELNDARIAQGRSEISLDLLAGSHATILSSFYGRALADQPAAVRRIIEDDLLTDSGFRENVAEERLLSRFSEVGAAPGTLALLVNRRLLRIEERLDVRRVELTHDVLCSVVRASRDRRKEREAREAAEHLLAEQQVREAAAHRSLLRARQVAGICTVLAIAAIAAAVFGYLSSRRAQRAEREALETRATAEQAREQSEHLIGYLTDDFVQELESNGRLNVLAEFTQRQIDYFEALPQTLKDPETTRNGALALIHHARAERSLGELGVAAANATEAIRLLEQQRAAGDSSEATAVALALAYTVDSRIGSMRHDPASASMGQRARALLGPIAEAPQASKAARRAYVEVLTASGFEQMHVNHHEENVRLQTRAMDMAAALGGRDLTDVHMGVAYADAAAWRVSSLVNLGHDDEAKKIGEEALSIGDRVLEQRPGYRRAMAAEQNLLGSLGSIAQLELDPLEGVRLNRRSEEISRTLLRLDPNNTVSINNMGVAHSAIADGLWAAGQMRESTPYSLKAIADYASASKAGTGTDFALSYAFSVAIAAVRQAQSGDTAAAAETLRLNGPRLDQYRKAVTQDGLVAVVMDAAEVVPAAEIEFQRGEFAAAAANAGRVLASLEATTPKGDFETYLLTQVRYVTALTAARSSYMAGDFKAAEALGRKALQYRTVLASGTVYDQRDLGEVSMWLSMSLAQQGRGEDAAQAIAPVVKAQRELNARNRGDRWLPLELASALYAQALSNPQHHAALLREAATLMDGLVPTVRSLHDPRMWRELIRKAQAGH